MADKEKRTKRETSCRHAVLNSPLFGSAAAGFLCFPSPFTFLEILSQFTHPHPHLPVLTYPLCLFAAHTATSLFGALDMPKALQTFNKYFHLLIFDL
jgi:hypothetical protein